MAVQTQKELVMKLSAKADPSIATPYKEMAKSAKEAATEEQKYQAVLKQRIRDYDQALRMKNDLAKAGIGREMTEEERYQRMFRQRIKDMETAKKLKDDLAKAGYGTTPAAAGGGLLDKGLGLLANPAALGAVIGTAIAAKIGGEVAKEIANRVRGQRIAEYGYTSSGRFGFDKHAAEKRQMEANAESLRTWLGWIPGLGGAIETGIYANRVSSPWYRREQNMRESREAVERNQVRGEILSESVLHRNQLERRAATYRALGGFTEEGRARMIREQQGIIAGNQHVRNTIGEAVTGPELTRRFEENARRKVAREDAAKQIEYLRAAAATKAFGMNSASEQARLREQAQKVVLSKQEELMGRPGAGGYNRQAALADYEARIGFQTAQKQADVENQRQLGILGYERNTAEAQERRARQRVANARSAVDTAAANASVPGLDRPQQIERGNKLLQAQIDLEKESKVLNEAIGHSQELRVRQAEMLNEQSVRRVSLLQDEATRLRGIVREENEREMGRREHFGLAHPMKQRTAVRIAEKLAKGQRVTFREQEFMQSMPELFDQRLRQIGFDRTGKGSAYEQIKRLLPELGERKRQAEKALANVNQQFHVQINLNEKGLADQIQRTVMPKIYEAVNQAVRAVQDQFLRDANQRRIQQNVQFGQP